MASINLPCVGGGAQTRIPHPLLQSLAGAAPMAMGGGKRSLLPASTGIGNMIVPYWPVIMVMLGLMRPMSKAPEASVPVA